MESPLEHSLQRKCESEHLSQDNADLKQSKIEFTDDLLEADFADTFVKPARVGSVNYNKLMTVQAFEATQLK